MHGTNCKSRRNESDIEKADEKGIDIKDLLIVDKGTFLGTPMHLAAEMQVDDIRESERC